MKIIARIHTDFPEKFGIPRQSNLVPGLVGRIVFEPEYRDVEALRGIEGFNYLWLLWEFQVPEPETWSPTVRPPRLGGNTYMGVWATRSPFRPNHIGLSSVKFKGLETTPEEGTVILVEGADLRDGTPIYDIKPYLKYVDCHEDAIDGFATAGQEHSLKVICDRSLLEKVEQEKRQGLIGVLSQDPRPSYHNDPERIYGLSFAGWNVRFKVEEDTLIVIEIIRE